MSELARLGLLDPRLKKADPNAIPGKQYYYGNMYEGPAIQPTPRNQVLGPLADAANYTIPKAISSVPDLLNEMSYGEMPYTGTRLTTTVDPRVADFADFMPGKAALTGVGVVGSTIGKKAFKPFTQPRHIPTNNKNPNPLVGNRYEVESLGGLLDPKIKKIEDFYNQNFLLLPYDSSSRNMAIGGVSDHMFKNKSVTHGGIGFGRAEENFNRGVAGASGLGIVKRVRDRVIQSRLENAKAGGPGVANLLTVTMGGRKKPGTNAAHDFSVQPTEVVFGILDNQPLRKADIQELDKAIRETPIVKKRKKDGKEYSEKTFPFKKFSGVMTDEGRIQLMKGTDQFSDGDIRKALMAEISKTKHQQAFKFNIQDLDNAITDKELMGIPKGYVGAAIIDTPSNFKIQPSSNATYNTEFLGDGTGSFGFNMPVEVLFKPKFDELGAEFANKYRAQNPTVKRNMIIGALEKRKEGISQIVDDDAIKRVNDYIKMREKFGLL